MVVVTAEQAAPSTRIWETQGHQGPAELRPDEGGFNDSSIIGLAGWFWIENQGASTGVVTLPPGTVVAGNQRHTRPLPTTNRPMHETPLFLAPKQGHLLYVQIQDSVRFWKERADTDPTLRNPLGLQVSIEDMFELGIRDRTLLLFRGVPISRTIDAQQVVSWIGTPEETTSITGGKIERTYTSPLRPTPLEGRLVFQWPWKRV